MKPMTIAQVSAVLGVKEATLNAWRFHNRQPLLQFHKIGGKVVYYESDVEAYIENCRRGGDISNNRSK